MKRLFLAASVAVAVMAASAPAANATTTLNITDRAADGSFSASFEGHDIQGPTFENVFHWEVLTDGVMNASIITSFVAGASTGDIDFTSVTINGLTFDLSPNGRRESGGLDQIFVHTGIQEMIVRGSSNGNGVYGGTLSFRANADPTGGVPEPASWALMIMGFGGVGAALRGKRRETLFAA